MTIKDPIIFVAGAAIGSGITYFVTKKILSDKIEKKFEAQYQEELQSVKDSFAYLAEEDKKKAAEAKEKPSLDVYMNAVNKTREREAAEEKENEKEPPRVNYSDPKSLMIERELEEEEDEDDADTPLVDTTIIDEDTDTSQPYILKRIPADDDYSRVMVTYYADGTYADARDAEMEIEDYIGKKMMEYVANSDKDEIFIRNEELELDIDIVKDNRTYDDVMFG